MTVSFSITPYPILSISKSHFPLILYAAPEAAASPPPGDVAAPAPFDVAAAQWTAVAHHPEGAAPLLLSAGVLSQGGQPV